MDFSDLIEQEANNHVTFNGILYIIPDKYVFSLKNGLKKKKFDKKGTLVGFDPISCTPVLINSILENIDTGNQKIELIFCNTGKKVIVEKSELYSHSKIVKLANKGMQVTSLTAKDWVEFISELEGLNSDVISKKVTVSRLGWVNPKTFIPYVKNDYLLDVNDNTNTWVESLEQKGSLSAWVLKMSELRKNNIFRYTFAVSFSAPLLKITGTRSFVSYNWAMSKGGKTAAAYCAMSVWGLAESLKVSFDATKNGVEGLSKIFADTPILIDERQIDRNQNKVEEIIYMFANGKSKLRATQTGGVQQNAKWRAIAISTGEEPLSNNQSQDGVRTRVLEIYGRPIDDEKTASEMYSFTQENYGLAGMIFVKTLIDKYSNNNYEDIINLFNKVKELIKKRCPAVNFAQLSYISLVTVADILIGKLFFKTDMESSLDMAQQIIENINKVGSVDLIDNAYNFIKEWLLSNDAKFDTRSFVKYGSEDTTLSEVIKQGTGTDRYGLYENDIFYIWPSKFTEKLQQQGFNPDKVKQGFKDRGYIVTDNENTTTVSLLFKGQKRNFIGVKLLKSDTVNIEQIEDLKNKKMYDFNHHTPTPKEIGIDS